MITCGPRLIAITDCSVASKERWIESLTELARLTAPQQLMIQLRDRDLALRERVSFGQELRAICNQTGQWFGVNDRADLALVLGADALHLGEAAVPTLDARKYAPELWISRALHEPERADRLDADAALLSPIHAPRKGAEALGLLGIERARRARVRGLLYALGGVNAENAKACLEAGADGVAAIGAILSVQAQSALVSALGIERR